MPRISEEIRNAALDGRLDTNALRAAVLADAAPRLFDACNDLYWAYYQRAKPELLKDAVALCGEVTRAVWRGLGYAQNMGAENPGDVGLAGVEADKARRSAERALGLLKAEAPDESLEYDGLGGARA